MTLAPLRYALTGTSSVGTDLILALRDRFPEAINTISYGSTEMGLALGITHDDILRKPDSVGLPAALLEARLDEAGELLLRGETMMSGYFDAPDQTAEAIQDGWYRSGDLARQDEDGYFTIVGRRREIIRSGGETIAPAEVEAALLGLAGVAEVAVVGLPHEAWGEVVSAAVVLEPGALAPTLDALRSHLAGRLANFKHPRSLRVIAELPRTGATGQTQRARVRDALISEKAE